MSYRWLWWTILAACLTMAAIYMAVLAMNKLGPNRPSARARLVWLLDRSPGRMQRRPI